MHAEVLLRCSQLPEVTCVQCTASRSKCRRGMVSQEASLTQNSRWKFGGKRGGHCGKREVRGQVSKEERWLVIGEAPSGTRCVDINRKGGEANRECGNFLWQLSRGYGIAKESACKGSSR
eukprot:7833338-Pyramimonas_sp.AAC.1